MGQKDVDHDRRILLIRKQVKHLKKQFLTLQHSMHWLNHRDKNFKYYFLQSSTRDLLNKLISLTYYFFTNAHSENKHVKQTQLYSLRISLLMYLRVRKTNCLKRKRFLHIYNLCINSQLEILSCHFYYLLRLISC